MELLKLQKDLNVPYKGFDIIKPKNAHQQMLVTEEHSDETQSSKRTQKDRQTFGTLHDALETTDQS